MNSMPSTFRLTMPELAKKIPSVRTFHGDRYVDNYAWMKDRDSDATRAYIDAQNIYSAQRVAHLDGLRRQLFTELSQRVQQTDMSVPVRMDGYWYFVRTQEGKQYTIQCRLRVHDENDWTPPVIDPQAPAGSVEGEEVIFDANEEALRCGSDFFQLGGMDISKDGMRMLYGVDITGDERYEYHVRDFFVDSQARLSFHEREERLPNVSSAAMSSDGRWIWYVRLDDAWRPYQVCRHRVGSAVGDDVIVFSESDERYWVGVSISFDERYAVISSSSKTTSRVLMLDLLNPEGDFKEVVEPIEGVEYDVSFACFEHAGEHGEDIPLAIISHNKTNPNFEIDVIDMRTAAIPYRLGDGVCVACGSPYGCEKGDAVTLGASIKPISTPYDDPHNPEILQHAVGLSIEGMAIYRTYVALAYRCDGLTHLAVVDKAQACADWLAARPWRFHEIRVPLSVSKTSSAAFGGRAKRLGQLSDDRPYVIGMVGNSSYDAPNMRYAYSSYTRLGQLREIDPLTGKDILLREGKILGDFSSEDYEERRIWVMARDGERIPVSLVWRPDAVNNANALFITGYGAYEVSSDPHFSVGRLSLLDRGVLYAVAHVRGGGEMGRAWYEQGRRLNKKHTFEDFIDVTRALQHAGYASADQTVANGGSAGGLLMGAVANMAPECFAGIEADVPFVDALTSMLDESLPLTVTEWDEWGDPLHHAEDYRYMKSYTPYENIPNLVSSSTGARRHFPRILITSSLNDTRVLVTEPLKWLAALQQAGVDAIARIDTDGGHAGTSGRYRKWEELSYENAWCLDAMNFSCANVVDCKL